MEKLKCQCINYKILIKNGKYKAINCGKYKAIILETTSLYLQVYPPILHQYIHRFSGSSRSSFNSLNHIVGPLCNVPNPHELTKH
jgi:hypothetical protein